MPWKLDMQVLLRAAYFHSKIQELTKLKAPAPHIYEAGRAAHQCEAPTHLDSQMRNELSMRRSFPG